MSMSAFLIPPNSPCSELDDAPQAKADACWHPLLSLEWLFLCCSQGVEVASTSVAVSTGDIWLGEGVKVTPSRRAFSASY